MICWRWYLSDVIQNELEIEKGQIKLSFLYSYDVTSFHVKINNNQGKLRGILFNGHELSAEPYLKPPRALSQCTLQWVEYIIAKLVNASGPQGFFIVRLGIYSTLLIKGLTN